MSKPDDIPQDVWDATDKPAFRVTLDVVAGQQWDIRPTIARAILAEREASARRGGDAIIAKHPILARQVRAAIRKGSD